MSKINKDNKFTQLVQKNKLKFYKTAKAILKNDDDVYDAIQNALMSMYQNFNNLKEQKYFATWGVRIVINKCYDLLRKNKKIELYKEKPKEGEFFGIITNVECFAPYYSDKSSYIYEGNIFDNGQAYV